MDINTLVLGVLSLVVAVVANAEVQRRSVDKGDGPLLVWGKGGLVGGLTLLLIWASYFAIGYIVNELI